MTVSGAMNLMVVTSSSYYKTLLKEFENIETNLTHTIEKVKTNQHE